MDQNDPLYEIKTATIETDKPVQTLDRLEGFSATDSDREETSTSKDIPTAPTPKARKDEFGIPVKDKDSTTFPFHLQKFTLYETKSRFYIVGSNTRETRFRILEIDLTAPKDTLKIVDNEIPYTRVESMQVLAYLEDKTKLSGGLVKRLTAWGIAGFIRFTEGYYMRVFTKRSAVALIGGHYIYHIDGTQLIPLCHSTVYRKPDRHSEEARYLSTLQNLDLSKTFYFSYTYDITHTLQHNMFREKQMAFDVLPRDVYRDYHEMFVWNHALLKPILPTLENPFRWCVTMIHGFIDQAKISVYGRSIYITIIARRSHYFAGARFLKRGVNDRGKVANEVETEQIVSDVLTTSFHDPKDGLFNNPRYTSYVQHRGSIPVYWSQDISNMSPKPPIELNAMDPFFSSAALHFDDMFRRYGSIVQVLNLIKSRERTPRESKLGPEFEQCINYLNQFLPKENQINYTAWDMSRASKSRDQEVIDFLETYAARTLATTGFFHNGKNINGMKIQNGVCRTNCIDCLDRTNAAQFVMGKKALGYQLHALGVLDEPKVDYDSDAVNLLTEMFHDHGDTIALQYGGSHLVNTMETYRKINQWTSHSRDMIESIRRFYSNSFVDSQRQDAINLFLGNFVWEKGQPMLWDFSNDYYLHNDVLSKRKKHRSYRLWWTPDNLQTNQEKLKAVAEKVRVALNLSEFQELNPYFYDPVLLPYRGFFDNYWNEYYKPRILSSLHLVFVYNMNSTLRYAPGNDHETFILGPFKSRKQVAPDLIQRKQRKQSKHKNEKTINNVSRAESSSFRIKALKRASQLYGKPGLSKLLAENKEANKLASEVTSTSSEAVESEELDETNNSSHDSDETLVDVESMAINLSNPKVSSQDLTVYSSFADHKMLSPTSFLQDPENHPEYDKYVSSCDVKFNDDDMEIYQDHYDVTQFTPSAPYVVSHGFMSPEYKPKEPLMPMYQSWLDGEHFTGHIELIGGSSNNSGSEEYYK